MNTLPISISDSETENARTWEMGIVARYVLPIYQDYYSLPQGAYLRSVEDGSPRRTRACRRAISSSASASRPFWATEPCASPAPRSRRGDIQTVYFWRDGQYYTTEMMRPET